MPALFWGDFFFICIFYPLFWQSCVWCPFLFSALTKAFTGGSKTEDAGLGKAEFLKAEWGAWTGPCRCGSQGQLRMGSGGRGPPGRPPRPSPSAAAMPPLWAAPLCPPWSGCPAFSTPVRAVGTLASSSDEVSSLRAGTLLPCGAKRGTQVPKAARVCSSFEPMCVCPWVRAAVSQGREGPVVPGAVPGTDGCSVNIC